MACPCGRAAWRMGATRPIWECHVACGRPARPVWHAAAAVCCGGASGAADGGAGLQLPRRWRGCGSPWWQRGQQGVAWRWRRERGRGVAAVSSVRWAVAGRGPPACSQAHLKRARPVDGPGTCGQGCILFSIFKI